MKNGVGFGRLALLAYSFIRAGADYSTWYGTKIKIKNVLKHLEYNKTSHENNLTVIELEMGI